MLQSGWAFSASSNIFCDARYQNECWYSMPRSNSFCASALHDVAKWTLPSLSSSDWAKAGWASDTPANTATSESDAFSMIHLPFPQIAMAFRDFAAARQAPAILFPPHCADFATKSGTCYNHGVQLVRGVCRHADA